MNKWKKIYKIWALKDYKFIYKQYNLDNLDRDNY